jgi:curved DNA-binding protein CbpA
VFLRRERKCGRKKGLSSSSVKRATCNNIEMDKEEDLDWYGILGVEIDATKEAIEKAARQLSRKYHPDRNKSAEAPQLFLNVQKAKDFLLDESKRKPYDENIRKLSKRKEYDAQRSLNMDSKRKKMKEDLEARLGKAQKTSHSQPTSSKQTFLSKEERHDMEEEIRKLRKDGLSRMHAAGQSDSTEEMMAQSTPVVDSKDLSLVQIKVKWKRGHQSHSDDSLCAMFRTFGHIEDATLLHGKGNTAILTFSTHAAALAAVNAYEGSSSLQVSLIGATKKASVFTHVYDAGSSSRGRSVFVSQEQQAQREGGAVSELMKEARRAVERDELLKQMMCEEAKQGQGQGQHEAAASATGAPAVSANTSTGGSSFAAFGARPQQSESSLYGTAATAPTAKKVDLASKESDILAKMLAMSSAKAATVT